MTAYAANARIMPVNTAILVFFFTRFRGRVFFTVIIAGMLAQILADGGRRAGFAISLQAAFDRVRLSARLTIICASDRADMTGKFSTLEFGIVDFIHFALAGWAADGFDMAVIFCATIRANARIVDWAAGLALRIGRQLAHLFCLVGAGVRTIFFAGRIYLPAADFAYHNGSFCMASERAA